jgi:hypothetical protein
MNWVLHRPRPQPLQTQWQADEIVVTRGGECVDRLRASEIERVTLVHAGDGESPGDVRAVLFELAGRAVLLDAASGIAGRVLFERQAYWAQRRCIYWVNERQLAWQAVDGARRWRFLRPRVPAHRGLPPATAAGLIERASLTGPHTWEQRKQHRIERRRPFPGRPLAATHAHGGALG